VCGVSRCILSTGRTDPRWQFERRLTCSRCRDPVDKWFPLISCDTVLALTRSQNLLHFLRLCPTGYSKLEAATLWCRGGVFRLGNAMVRLCNVIRSTACSFFAAYRPPVRRHSSIFLLRRYPRRGQPAGNRQDHTIKRGKHVDRRKIMARPTRLISCLLNGQAGFLDHLFFADG
jgi:hypothetical protein